jgi:hypothetical protein
MGDRTFVVAVDAREPRSEAAVFRKALQHNPGVTAWWNHLPYIYLVTSPLSADELSANLFERSQLDRFLVMEVNPAESEGLLPERAWDWIRKRSNAPADLRTN